MSQYNKTILTNAGLELAKRANAGQAKFEITRAVTSADDWSNKTIQDLEEVTAIPNIMQQGTIMDTEEVESNNSVIGVSLCFANKDLSTGYQIRIIGVYVKEEGQENDFLYAVTTAVSPEYMPDFNDKVLYRFNMQMYLVIGKAQAVNVVINDGASVTHGQFDKYKGEVTASLEKIENAHKEDMSHVVKSASINGGDEILPNETGKLELVVPDPDLSKYVSLEQLTETLKTKADITAVPDKTATEEGIKQAKELAQEADTKAQSALDNKADKADVTAELAKKDDTSDVDAKIKTVTNLANTKANANDVYNRSTVDNAFTEVRGRLSKLEGTQTLDSPDFNGITASGVYYITNNNGSNIKNNPVAQWGVLIVSNGDGHRVSQVYYPDDGNPPWYRSLDESTWRTWYQLSTRNDVNNATNAANAASNKVDTVLTNSYFRKQGMDQNGNAVEIRANAVKQTDGGYAFDICNTDWTASKLKGVLDQLPSKANSSDVSTDISNLQSQINSKTSGTIVTAYDIASKTPTKETNSYTNKWLVDQNVLGQFADQINQLKGRRAADAPDFNTLTDPGAYLISNASKGTNYPPNAYWGVLTVFTASGGGYTWTIQIYAEENGTDFFVRMYGWIGGMNAWGSWNQIAWKSDITDLQNQIQQLKDNQFEVQTFTDATAAANWEAQRPGKRMAIIQS